MPNAIAAGSLSARAVPLGFLVTAGENLATLDRVLLSHLVRFRGQEGMAFLYYRGGRGRDTRGWSVSGVPGRGWRSLDP